MYRSLLIVAALLLAGCATHSPQAEAEAKAQGVAADDAKCRASGLQPGTPEFEKCLAKLADLRAQAETNDRAALAGRLQGRPPPGFDTSTPSR